MESRSADDTAGGSNTGLNAVVKLTILFSEFLNVCFRPESDGPQRIYSQVAGRCRPTTAGFGLKLTFIILKVTVAGLFVTHFVSPHINLGR